ncbi:hypothetical protein QYF61_004096 [Mycteria americana]|uniref:E3 ubiquitin-protein ligase Topors n=1 Tax=Mycteria americana TaxID=33587 RepID=A0AAN7MXU3_MYCAM|nr:hypothetical protein QYF61_004096 [Mycteria americana]
MEKILLRAIERHFKDNAIIRHSQHRFTKRKSCLTNLRSFYDKVTRLVGEGKVVDVACLDFSKAFDTVPHSILLDKLSSCEMNRCTLHWAKNWLNSRVQGAVVNGTTAGWWPVTSAVPQSQFEGQSSSIFLSMIWRKELNAPILSVPDPRAVEGFSPALPPSGSRGSQEARSQQQRPANDRGLSSFSSVTPAAAAPVRGSSSTSPAPHSPPQRVESMASELEDRCPICLDSWEEASFVVPCLHRFCYPCILRWAESKPECPLCKRRILSILHSVWADDDYREHVITPSLPPSVVVHQAGGAPGYPAAHDLHHPGAPQPWAAEGVPRRPAGGLQPEEWMILFQDHPTLLETLLPWVQPRLRQIFRNNRREAAMVEDTVMAILTNHGMDEELLVQMLVVSLQNHTVTFVQQLIHVAVRRCSREARRLLGQQEGLPCPAQCPPAVLQYPVQMSSPAPHPLPLVGVPAATPLLPLPSLLEQEEPQEEPGEAVPRASTPSWGSEHSSGGPWQPPKRRTSSSEASLANKRPAPHQ